MFIQKFLNNARHNPLELIVGLCVLILAAAGAAVHNVASTSLAVMFLISLLYVREWGIWWSGLERLEKLLFAGFIIYTLSALLSWVNADDSDEFVKLFGRYIRFTMIIPVYLMMRSKRLDVTRYFIAGIILSGFVYFGYALHSMFTHPEMPAQGGYHHITFGDASMMSVGLMGIMLLMPQKKPIIKVVIAISMLCALYAAFMSQARGAWVVLPVYLLIFVGYNAVSKKAAILQLLVFGGLLSVLLVLTPAGKVIEKRYDEAVTEVTQFASGERFDTSVGGRLAMWDIALDVWREHPFVGTGLGDFDEDLMRYQAMGKYPGIEVHGSTHNIFVQALVGTGVIGLIALCYALVIAPLVLFLGYEGRQKSYAEMGVLIIASYIVFGLSESWILRAPAISIYLAYVITLTNSLNSK